MLRSRNLRTTVTDRVADSARAAPEPPSGRVVHLGPGTAMPGPLFLAAGNYCSIVLWNFGCNSCIAYRTKVSQTSAPVSSLNSFAAGAVFFLPPQLAASSFPRCLFLAPTFVANLAIGMQGLNAPSNSRMSTTFSFVHLRTQRALQNVGCQQKLVARFG